jgi:hypothetical protein
MVLHPLFSSTAAKSIRCAGTQKIKNLGFSTAFRMEQRSNELTLLYTEYNVDNALRFAPMISHDESK